MTELVSPGGDLEKIKTAILFGADAVYVGAGDFSLRNQAASLSLEQLSKAIQFVHKRACKIYLALNIFTFDSDYQRILEYLQQAVRFGIDAVIISDPGLLQFINTHLDQKPRIHISTQANVTNSHAVKFWQQQGASRIVLARELSFEQIKEIRQECPNIELEIFVHGAMCMSYSGRCLLSDFMTGRSANRGECTQPCRWPYHLKEKSRPDENFTLEEDNQGTYVMNSKDLCLLEYLPKLIDIGINSFKIEGRMKPAYYVALVVKTYKEAISRYLYDKDNFKISNYWLKRLDEVSHRPYSTGFTFPESEKQNLESSSYIKKYNFVGKILKVDKETGLALVEVRNRIKAGDIMEIIDPYHPQIQKYKAESFLRDTGEETNIVHNQYFVNIKFPFEVSPHSLIRVKI